MPPSISRSAGIPIDPAVDQPIPPADIVLDCLLGTGSSGAPRGAIAAAIASACAGPAPVLACDIPSGIDPDTGEVAGAAIRARTTVALSTLKRGLLLHPGAAHAGAIRVAAIGIPAACFPPAPDHLATRDLVRGLLPERAQHRDANKGSFGKVLVVAGSRGMAGAAVLAGTAALRAGAGLVHVAVPHGVLGAAATLAPELVFHAMPETASGGHGGAGAWERLEELLSGVDAVAAGPGLGRDPAALALVRDLVRRTRLPLVVDADGLAAFAGTAETLRPSGPPVVLTPHPGEMARLRGIASGEVQARRWDTAREAAISLGAVVLLKGARTVIGEPTGGICVNRDGSPALATAGSGDVLTGVVAALLAAGLAPWDAARAGAYLHALAGERAAAPPFRGGVLAGEIRDHLPGAWRDILENPDPTEPIPCR